MKKTLILGASNNPSRYAYLAADLLLKNRHEIVPVGVKRGDVFGIPISKEFPEQGSVDTVTLYVNPEIQKEYYSAILDLKPNRIIFNPGTENNELRTMAHEAGIETEYACTLVLLNSGQY